MAPQKTSPEKHLIARRITRRTLYLCGVIFIVTGLLIYFYPETVENILGLNQSSSRILAAGIIIAGIADFIFAKLIFGKSDRV